MTLFAGEDGVEEAHDQGLRDLVPDYPGAQAQDVHVVVLDPLSRRVGVVAQARAHPAYLVGRYTGAHAAAADDDASVDRAVRYPASHQPGEIRVVVAGVEGMSADVLDLMVQAPDELDDGSLQLVPGMVRAYRYPHFS